MIEKQIFLLDVLGLILAPLPTFPPVADQELEEEGINLHAGLKADAQISKVHLVLIRVSQEKTEMACNGKEKVVVEGWKIGEFLDEHLWDINCASAFPSNSILGLLRKYLIW